jgi:hypothetical protein
MASAAGRSYYIIVHSEQYQQLQLAAVRQCLVILVNSLVHFQCFVVELSIVIHMAYNSLANFAGAGWGYLQAKA